MEKGRWIRILQNPEGQTISWGIARDREQAMQTARTNLAAVPTSIVWTAVELFLPDEAGEEHYDAIEEFPGLFPDTDALLQEGRENPLPNKSLARIIREIAEKQGLPPAEIESLVGRAIQARETREQRQMKCPGCSTPISLNPRRGEYPWDLRRGEEHLPDRCPGIGLGRRR